MKEMNNFFKKYSTVKINCHGGILSPGKLSDIATALEEMGVSHLRFGLRQCIYIDLHPTMVDEFTGRMQKHGIPVYVDESRPNIISAYPIEEIFPSTSWVREGIYKDILDTMEHSPKLKINLLDAHQTMIPRYTGNINWVASPLHKHYWHLYIRFPKTNSVIKWNQLIYTNDLMRFSRSLENYIVLHHKYNLPSSEVTLERIHNYLNSYEWISIPDDEALSMTPFNLTYYEGLNPYGDYYWLGIYQRDEKFAISFIKDICALCMETRVGQICTTPWKSIIIKGIVATDRSKWNHLLNKHLTNVRHPLNELNFQVEDNNPVALNLKQYLARQFNEDDIRTHGICFGIKTRLKSEVFCNILIKRRHLIRIGRLHLLPVYDILTSKDFNPNERTGNIYAKGLFRYLLADQLVACLVSYFKNRSTSFNQDQSLNVVVKSAQDTYIRPEYIYRCDHCHTWVGEDTQHQDLETVVCSVCEAPGTQFSKVNKYEILEFAA